MPDSGLKNTHLRIYDPQVATQNAAGMLSMYVDIRKSLDHHSRPFHHILVKRTCLYVSYFFLSGYAMLLFKGRNYEYHCWPPPRSDDSNK